MLDAGIKIHQWFLEQTTGKFPEEVKKAGYNYEKAKQNIHSLDYGVEPGKMSQESKLPLYVSQWQYNFFHETFPGIRRRMYRIQKTVESTRSLTSFLGRKKIFLAPFGRELLNQAYAWPSQSVIGELTILALNKLYWRGVLARNVETLQAQNFLNSAAVQVPWTFPALNTHDGLVIRYFLGEEEKVKESVRVAFDIPLQKKDLSITIPVEIGWGMHFNEMHDVEVIRYV